MLWNLNLGLELYQMFKTCPRIRRSIKFLTHKMITMLCSENLDPTTLSFRAISPCGEPRKMFITLEKALYITGPLKLPEDTPQDNSFQLTRTVDSLYKAVLEDNGYLRGYLQVSEGLCDLVYCIALHLHRFYTARGRRDLKEPVVWDVYDHWTSGDLCISGAVGGA